MEKFPKFLKKYKDILRGRSAIVKRAKIYPIECVVRGYITGSAWEEYQETGKIGGLKLGSGLRMCDRLPEPIFTPTTKESVGHDIAITITKAKKIFGADVVNFLMDKSIELYLRASQYALDRGIIIADTKFEFGEVNGEIILVDEVLTPDSSRFWLVSEYKPGQPQKNLDKQFVRDYLLGTDWDRKSSPPQLPPDVIKKTTE